MSLTIDLLHFECDSSCASCGHRVVHDLTVHHLEQTQPKDESYDNKLILCKFCHQNHHDGKSPSKKGLLDIKRRLIMKTLTTPGLNALKQAYRRGHVVAMPFLVSHLLEQRYLYYTEVVSNWVQKQGDRTSVVDITAVYAITQRGKALLDKWKLK